MANFDSLPNELIGRIIQLLVLDGAVQLLLPLCRVSKRFSELVRPSIYQTVKFENGPDLPHFFRKSGITKVPAGTLRQIRIWPGEESSFIGLGVGLEQTDVETPQHNGLQRRFLERVKKHCVGVECFDFASDWEWSNMEDSHPSIYLPLFRAMNPVSIFFDSDFSSCDMASVDRNVPELRFSSLLSAFSSFTRLTYLRMPFVDFDKVEKPQIDILSRLPLHYIHLDWPTNLTPAKLLDIMDVLPCLRKEGLVISSHTTMFGMEVPVPAGREDEDADAVFIRKNKDFTLKTIDTYFKTKRRWQLLPKLNWRGPGRIEDEWDDLHGIDQLYEVVRMQQLRG